MTINELLNAKVIPLGAIIAYMLIEFIGLMYRRTRTNKEHDCKSCKRWECEGKWCYYKNKK